MSFAFACVNCIKFRYNRYIDLLHKIMLGLLFPLGCPVTIYGTLACPLTVSLGDLLCEEYSPKQENV